MGKAKKEELNQILIARLNTIHDTLQLFDRTPPPTQDKVSWNHVLQMADHLSRQATIVGMLWTGAPPEAEAVKETMESYFNALQGFLLHCHGSTVGAGPTLSSTILASAKQVVDSSFKLLQGSVSLYDGSYEKDRKPSVLQLAGAVWEAFSALKKAPATNITAIGRAMTQVAVSVKDVLREMRELKPASSSPREEASGDNASKKPESGSRDDENSDEDDDLGNDLSPEEMKIANMAAGVVSETLVVTKELIRAITGMIKLEKAKDNCEFVDSLEKLLKLCQENGVEIDELGACVYPPQEVAAIQKAIERIRGNVGEMEAEVEGFKSSPDAFLQACEALRSRIKHMKTELDRTSRAEVVARLQNVTLGG